VKHRGAAAIDGHTVPGVFSGEEDGIVFVLLGGFRRPGKSLDLGHFQVVHEKYRCARTCAGGAERKFVCRVKRKVLVVARCEVWIITRGSESIGGPGLGGRESPEGVETLQRDAQRAPAWIHRHVIGCQGRPFFVDGAVIERFRIMDSRHIKPRPPCAAQIPMRKYHAPLLTEVEKPRHAVGPHDQPGPFPPFAVSSGIACGYLRGRRPT